MNNQVESIEKDLELTKKLSQEAMIDKTSIKKVKFDFLRGGDIGCIHVEVNCNTIEDLKEAIAFAKEASKLIPPIDTKLKV